jgi:hypothetical protein
MLPARQLLHDTLQATDRTRRENVNDEHEGPVELPNDRGSTSRFAPGFSLQHRLEQALIRFGAPFDPVLRRLKKVRLANFRSEFRLVLETGYCLRERRRLSRRHEESRLAVA